MPLALVTGSAGLVGSEACKKFHAEGMEVVGIDNDLRSFFFGAGASTAGTRASLEASLANYSHHAIDIRDAEAVFKLFQRYGRSLDLIVHAAAQPSHDWAARDPFTDFGVNANGTLNLLEAARRFSPDAVFIFMSTNKVYGDASNALPLQELDRRWEIAGDHRYQAGIDETLSTDQSKHSLYGCSKLAADVLVQEYGRYFGLKTVCFRGGCLSGPAHAGTELHGFLSYLMKCTVSGQPYQVFGYQGKQVRDNLHSHDLVNAFWSFYLRPGSGAVYNIGGGRHSNCSMLEAIDLCEEISGRKLDWSYQEENRSGDHIWWISDVRRFKRDYPEWDYRYDLPAILQEIHAAWSEAKPG